MQSRYLEILDFTQFFDHFVFTPNAENVLEKELKREIPVSVGIELVVVDMSKAIHITRITIDKVKLFVYYIIVTLIFRKGELL